MLANDGASYFRNRFLQFNIEEFRKDVDLTKDKNVGQIEDVMVEFIANAYVGVVEWWLKNKMPYPPQIMAEKVGELLERII